MTFSKSLPLSHGKLGIPSRKFPCSIVRFACLFSWLVALLHGFNVTASAASTTSFCSRQAPIVAALEKFARKPCFQIVPKDLRELTRLEISNAKFSGLAAQDFEGLDSLVDIRIYGSELGIVDIENMSTLRDLSLTNSPIDRLVLNNLPSLTALRIGRNQLVDLQLQGTPSLVVLDASDNRLRSIDLAALSNRLQLVDLSGNLLTAIPDGMFSGMAICSLNLARNQLTSLRAGLLTGVRAPIPASQGGVCTPGAFGKAPSQHAVFSIFLGSNPLRSVDENLFNNPLFLGQKLVRNVDISNTTLSSLPPKLISQLPYLYSLNLSYNANLATLSEDFFSKANDGLNYLGWIYIQGSALAEILKTKDFKNLTAVYVQCVESMDSNGFAIYPSFAMVSRGPMPGFEFDGNGERRVCQGFAKK